MYGHYTVHPLGLLLVSHGPKPVTPHSTPDPRRPFKAPQSYIYIYIKRESKEADEHVLRHNCATLSGDVLGASPCNVSPGCSRKSRLQSNTYVSWLQWAMPCPLSNAFLLALSHLLLRLVVAGWQSRLGDGSCQGCCAPRILAVCNRPQLYEPI